LAARRADLLGCKNFANPPQQESENKVTINVTIKANNIVSSKHQ
jgi:hypothetical protein